MKKIDGFTNVLTCIQDAGIDKKKNGYSIDKTAIANVFCKTRGDTCIDILARLSILDNMYSTQMGLRYYGLDDLAMALLQYGKDSEERTKNFLTLLNTVKADNNHSGKNIEIPPLFTNSYGIGKDGDDKGRALSLITKYAYFETQYRFPIYDSIVKEMYLLILAYCEIREPKIKRIGDSIESFLPAIKYLKEELTTRTHQNISFDDLDQLLWITGKILRGNMSLVFNKEQYKLYGNNFNIRTWDLPSLKRKFKAEYIYPFLILAKELSLIETIDLHTLRISGIVKYFSDVYNINMKIETLNSIKDLGQKTLVSIARELGHPFVRDFHDTVIGLQTTIQQVYDIFQSYGLEVKLYEEDYDGKKKIQYNKLVDKTTTIQNYLTNMILTH